MPSIRAAIWRGRTGYSCKATCGPWSVTTSRRPCAKPCPATTRAIQPAAWRTAMSAGSRRRRRSLFRPYAFAGTMARWLQRRSAAARPSWSSLYRRLQQAGMCTGRPGPHEARARPSATRTGSRRHPRLPHQRRRLLRFQPLPVRCCCTPIPSNRLRTSTANAALLRFLPPARGMAGRPRRHGPACRVCTVQIPAPAR